jgi:ATP-dependent Clp protease adaptor protein ClpS
MAIARWVPRSARPKSLPDRAVADGWDEKLGIRVADVRPRMMSGPTPGPAAPEVKPDVRVRPAPRYKVFVHNDDVTPMWFVTQVLQGIFGLEGQRAMQVMLEAHHEGVAFVVALSFEQAEFRVEQAHAMARTARYPLKFTYEPE